MLFRLAIALSGASFIATPAIAAIEAIDLPASRQRGLDMIVIDEDAMPPEPEFARTGAEPLENRFGVAAIDPTAPVHHLYSDLQHKLNSYRERWSGLPQLKIGDAASSGVGSADPRVPDLRQRLGLARPGGFDKALEARLKAYQRAHGLLQDGKAGAETLASLNQGAAYFERVIQLNMERARRLPAPGLKSRYALVDAGAARLWMYENGRPVDSMKVVVGARDTETPMLAGLLRYSSVNPYWNVPPELVTKLIAPRVLEQGLTYLSDRKYQVLDGWAEDAGVVDPASVDWKAVASSELDVRVRQLPGPGNSMGEVKFMMPNVYGIYLHDTPNKALFESEERWVSNGCVRVEDARRLAIWLHGEMPKGSSRDLEERIDLPEPVPVYVTYFTVEAGTEGVAFRRDRYGRDAAVLARFPADSRMIDPDKQFREAMALGT